MTIADAPDVVRELGTVAPPAERGNAREEPTRHPGDLPAEEPEEGAEGGEAQEEPSGGPEGEGEPETPEETAAREAAEAAADETDFEFGAHKLRVPKALAEELKKGVMLHADYTQKTMAIGEKERAVAAREKEHEAYVKAASEDINTRAAYVAKYQELEQYGKVDWQAWTAQDPVAAQQAFIRSQQLRAELQGLGTQIQQRNQQRTLEAQQASAKRLSDTLEYAKREIPGWSPDLDTKLGEFARSQGVGNDELQANLSPTIYKMLHLAYLGSQAVAKATTVKPPQKPIAPLRVVGAKANPPAVSDPAKMSTEQYVAWRKRGGGGGKIATR